MCAPFFSSEINGPSKYQFSKKLGYSLSKNKKNSLFSLIFSHCWVMVVPKIAATPSNLCSFSL
ncbi:Predicted protein [Mesomycoplasma hyopneumoniae 168]|uniref:Uncharacterized protein n=1 Tax=Mesomycoplasma hyopneumoniae (strain 168) TaxID=907287 RepID=E4QTM6_MESH1|nr:Predicted protein [Mesomycoplasma hyopneumoniae 168]